LKISKTLPAIETRNISSLGAVPQSPAPLDHKPESITFCGTKFSKTFTTQDIVVAISIVKIFPKRKMFRKYG
jgi:hypothetical protein